MVRIRALARGLLMALITTAAAPFTGLAAEPDTASVVDELRNEARQLARLVHSELARCFLDGAGALPRIEPRTVLHDSARTRYWTEADARSLPDSTRSRLLTRTLDERFYYYTRYGTPLAYARALDLLAGAGLRDVRRCRLLDFGYGAIGHLKLLAALGADAHGVKVDPLLAVLYGPGDHGAVAGGGSVRLHDGRFPADTAVVEAIGAGYDVFISKNTLKNGYIHPAQKVDPRMLVHLGVGDTAYVRAVAQILKPGGLAMIYNLCPAPNGPGKPYKPWADGRCPFPRALWEAEGFQVLAFDRDDTEAARAMAHALGWDQGEGAMNLRDDLFASYTLLRRKRG